jgi:hypothetical protein
MLGASLPPEQCSQHGDDERTMTALTSSSVTIQTTEQSAPSVPGWFGEVAVVANYLRGCTYGYRGARALRPASLRPLRLD